MKRRKCSHGDHWPVDSRRIFRDVVMLGAIGIMLSMPVPIAAMERAGSIENRGQVDELVLYYAPVFQPTVYFTSQALVLDLSQQIPAYEEVRDPVHGTRDLSPSEDLSGSSPWAGCAVWIRFEAANPSPTVEARGELTPRYSFFLGMEPNRWQTDVRTYEEIVYRDLWPGIDLVYRVEEDRVCYKVEARPGADRSLVGFRYEGADRIAVIEDGSERIETPVGALVHVPPAAGEEGVLLLARENNTFREDPGTLTWSSFLGGSASDYGRAIALDESLNVYITGFTGSSNFPTTPGVYDTTFNSTGATNDVFVAKLNAGGDRLKYATFLGGYHDEYAYDIALGDSGAVYLTGWTASNDFPTTQGAFDRTHEHFEGFVTKLDPAGSSLLYSTYLGGSGGAMAFAIAVDDSGYAYVTGSAGSGDFPTTPGAFDRVYNIDDAFVTKLNPEGSDLVYSTFLGGNGGANSGLGIAVDGVGEALVTGRAGPDFPTTEGVVGETYGGGFDGFITRLNVSGSDLVYSTYLGGSLGDAGYSIALDDVGNAHVLGETHSDGTGFPTTDGAFNTTPNGWIDAFVTKMNPTGDTLIYSTFLGGSNHDYGKRIALDASLCACVTGETASSEFPTTSLAYDETFNGDVDAFVTRFSVDGSEVTYSTFLGGSSGDAGWGIATGGSNVVVTGEAGSGSFPTTTGVYDSTYGGGGRDVFVSKLDPSGITSGVSPAVHEAQFGLPFGMAVPNPFRSEITLYFDNPLCIGGRVDVFDVGGRLVRRLAGGEFPAGRSSLVWDGRDDTGRQLPAGIYLTRIQTSRGVATRRAILVR